MYWKAKILRLSEGELFFRENLLFADWKLFALRKITILSGIVDVELTTVLALQQKLFCCVKVGSSSQEPRVCDD